MKITLVGSGYVGLVTGACLADLGHNVVCVDKDEQKIKSLKKGKVPFFEPGLEELIKTNAGEGRLSFTASIKEGIAHGLIIFITVDTPSLGNGEADLSFVEAVAKDVALNMKDYRLIVEKSTVPVQTGEWIARTMNKYIRKGIEFDVASNPEFLREGSAIKDFMHPDRVVIGTSSDKASSLLVKLYEPLNAPLLLTDIKSAELIKHCANAFLATKISFINAVSQLCDKTGADILKVAKGIGLDRRIGMEFLQAGIGFGGSCFPKDLAAFIKIAGSLGYDFKLLKAVEEINHQQKRLVIKKLENALGSLEGRVITLWGLTFKADTDDLRKAPSLDIIKMLQKKNAGVRAHDPIAIEKARKIIPGIEYFNNPYDAVKGADALVVVTEWNLYRSIDLPKVKKNLKTPVLIDGRNIYDPARMKLIGFNYSGIGR